VNIQDKLKTLPKKPGVYLHKDINGTVIYVGKAINLFNRVNSYFKGAHDYKTTKLVSNIVDFDYIVTKSEKEALILEYNLIKQYDPKFNIVFKDDKSYPYILLKDCIEPCVSVVRKKKNTKFKGKLFGPYPDVGAARNMVDLINKIFETRKCDNLQKDLCLYYHIKQCPGYCKFSIDESKCNEIKNKIISFLNGDISFIKNDLKQKMNEYSNNLDFENAILYKNLIKDIEETVSKQDVQINNRETFDVFNYYVEDGYIAITGLFVKNGILLSTEKFIDYLVGDPVNFTTSYIYQFYEINQKPKALYIPLELDCFLSESFNTITVSKGHKKKIIEQAKTNCVENIHQNKNIITKSESYYSQINDEFLRIFKSNINRIELFDNSHTGGTNTVGAMIVYKNFKTCKKEYRLFKLEEGGNDLASMKEMLYRRYFRVLKDNLERPDLIIVDGGRIQIDAAKEIINSLGLNIIIAGLGKDEHHNTSYLMDSQYNIIDINKESNLFFFLTNMQDEVHRFAITYHKKLRSKAVYKSVLDNIPGLGPKTRMKLLRKYGSINKLKELSKEELSSILSDAVAEKLYNKLHENTEESK